MSESFSNPQETVLQMGLKEGDKVADFGAGTGHYSRAAAGVVCGSGTVYAVDIQEDVLKHAKLNAHASHRGAIEHVWGNIEQVGGSHLREASLDAVILANVLFQLEDRAVAVSEIRRVLRPGGKLLVVDWSGSFGGMGPTPQQVVSEKAAEELFTASGFVLLKSFRSGAHHYAILFMRQ